MNKAIEAIKELEESTEKSVNSRVEQICKSASVLSHDSKKELVGNWELEAEALHSIAENYMRDSLGVEGEMSTSLRAAAARCFAQAELYSKCAANIKKQITEPKTY